MKISRIPVSKINTVEWNPRVELQPGDSAYEKLRSSLDRFGLVEPLVWNERSGNLIGGHQRLKVLIEAGQTEVDVSCVDLPPSRERELNLALNKISGDWDEAKLGQLFDEMLRMPDFNIITTGFETQEVDRIIADLTTSTLRNREENFDVEASLSEMGTSVTKPGEIITLGDHRLMCGDATATEDVARLMAGRKATLIITDPPYGTDAGGHEPQAAGRNRVKRIGQLPWDKLTSKQYLELLTKALKNAHVFSDSSAALYLWFAARRIRQVHAAMEAAGYVERSMLVWAKDRITSWLHGHYKYQYELAYYGSKKNMPLRWYGPSNASNLLQCARPPKVDGHPTVKPLELIELAIENSSQAGGLVLDLFGGSGTTIMAAARTGRACYMMEINPTYCDVTVRRFISLIGKGCVPPEVAARYSQKVRTDNEFSSTQGFLLFSKSSYEASYCYLMWT